MHLLRHTHCSLHLRLSPHSTKILSSVTRVFVNAHRSNVRHFNDISRLKVDTTSNQWRQLPPVASSWLRDAYCRDITRRDVGRELRVAGIVRSVRCQGMLQFIVITDEDGGIMQAVNTKGTYNKAVFDVFTHLAPNAVVSMTGIIAAKRPRDDTELEAVEIHVTSVQQLAFPRLGVRKYQRGTSEESEEIQMKDRHLQLRNISLQNNLRIRSRAVHALRTELHDDAFVEIETPNLTRSSPQGAHEYLVRAGPYHYYALSQSPQQYKQLLMAASFEKYFQIARCFRREDGRSDRQAEFTQLDLEMSYARGDDIRRVIERVLYGVNDRIPDLNLDLPTPHSVPKANDIGASEAHSEAMDMTSAIPCIRYDDAIRLYGSDKPDLRLGMRITCLPSPEGSTLVMLAPIELSDLDTPSLRALKLEFPEFKIIEIDAHDRWTRVFREDHVRMIRESKIYQIGKMIIALRTPKPPEKEVDNIGFIKPEPPSELWMYELTGHVRARVGQILRSKKLITKPERRCWLWVTEFPMFKENKDGGLSSVHHPFTKPLGDADALLTLKRPELLALRSSAYDLVCDGHEIGGGSERITSPGVQHHVLCLILAECDEPFGALLRAFSHGCPPHAGIALGIDRLMAVCLSERASLRDVMAFPKTALGKEVMSGAPSLQMND